MQTEPFFTAIKPYLAFPFKDTENKNRFFIGVAVMFASMFIPVIPMIFVYGQYYQMMRKVANEGVLELPPWEDWGRLFIDGLKLFGLTLIFFLPSLVVMAAGYILYFSSFFSVMFSSNHGYVNPLLFFIGFIAMFGGLFFGTLLGIVLAIPWPAAMVHMVAQDRFAAAFEFKTWWQVLRNNKFNYFIAWIVAFGLLGLMYTGYMLLYMTLILCFFAFIFIIPAMYYAGLVANALFAEVYREGMQKE